MMYDIQLQAIKAGQLADKLQQEDPTLTRIQAVQKALEILHGEDD